MRYFGGKQRIADHIAQVIKTYRTSDDVWFFEPFLGGANIAPRLTGKRVASDANKPLIALYKALQNGFVPPTEVSRELYTQAQRGEVSPELQAFIGFGCSFAGKWFGGYASSDDRNYALNAYNSLMKKVPGLQGIHLIDKPYTEFRPSGMVVYCDPPYQGTTQYGAVGAFDSAEFWNIMQVWARDNTVLVSEYTAPDFCKVVWEKQVRTDIRGKDGRIDRTEKLFLVVKN